MMNRRNLLLQEMGINQWQLSRPDVLQGAVAIDINENIRFIVVADENISQQPLFADMLRSLELNKEDCLCLNFEQLQHLTVQHSVNYWLLDKNFPKNDRSLPNANRIFHSTDWQTLLNDPQQKRQLWQQIQRTE